MDKVVFVPSAVLHAPVQFVDGRVLIQSDTTAVQVTTLSGETMTWAQWVEREMGRTALGEQENG